MAVAALAAGCKSDCEEVCEWSKECASAEIENTFLGNASCGDLCDLQDDFAEIIGCEDVWDDYTACAADNLPEGCRQTTAGPFCEAETRAFTQCFGVDDDE